MQTPQSTLTVSLEPHLLETLSPLPAILPPPLSSSLSTALSTAQSSTPEISYTLLSQISQWSRTPSALPLLESKSLDPNAYLMISLLAGTKTSPSSKLPKYEKPIHERPEENAKRQMNDKKEITAILNSLLSVGASGFAVWWAADKVGWRDEWKALLALFAALVVAIAEITLYVIWQSKHKSKSPRSPSLRRRVIAGAHNKKEDVNVNDINADIHANLPNDLDGNGTRPEPAIDITNDELDSERLRRRRITAITPQTE